MMAGGGIIALRQGAKFGKVFRSVGKVVSGVAKAVKSVAKSPIGMIALSVAAPYAIGAMFPGFATLGTSTLGTFGGAALRAGISNLAIQGITTGKINPKQALLAAAAGGALSGLQGAAGATTPGVSSAASAADAGFGTSPFGEFGGTTLQGGVTGIPSSAASSPNFLERGIANVREIGTKLMSDPVGTIGRGLGSLYDTTTKAIKENPLLSVGGAFLLGQQFRDPLPGEDPNEYNKLKAAHDSQVAGYVTQYGRGAKVYSPGEFGLYAREKAVDPFAGLPTYAADGGRIGFQSGTPSLEKQTLIKKGYGDMIKNMSESEILKLYDSVMGTFSRRFQAGGSMPMGEPRKNPAGIMELDYRKTGGFVPPIGIKEKADDIPAMLSNNEFVFTADAVRNAGGGNVNKGAERMYSLMKNLEAGGIA